MSRLQVRSGMQLPRPMPTYRPHLAIPGGDLQTAIGGERPELILGASGVLSAEIGGDAALRADTGRLGLLHGLGFHHCEWPKGQIWPRLSFNDPYRLSQLGENGNDTPA